MDSKISDFHRCSLPSPLVRQTKHQLLLKEKRCPQLARSDRSSGWGFGVLKQEPESRQLVALAAVVIYNPPPPGHEAVGFELGQDTH